MPDLNRTIVAAVAGLLLSLSAFAAGTTDFSGSWELNTDKGQNLDSYSIEWTFADGTKAYDYVSYIPKCHNDFATYIQGSEKSAQFSGNIHAGTTKIFKDRRVADDNVLWEAPKEVLTPWQAQWNDFTKAIRQDTPFNQAKSAALTNLTAKNIRVSYE